MDSTAIQGEITEVEGRFLFENLATTSYKLIIQMLGCQDWVQDLHLNQSIDLGKITLTCGEYSSDYENNWQSHQN